MSRVKQNIFGTVYVTDADGARHAFVAGDEIPEWAAPRMRDVTDDGTSASAEPVNTGEVLVTGSDDPSDDDGPVAPPRSGPGSGVQAWRTYAETLGVDVPDDASRDDIVDLLDNR